jgi:acetyl-CoA carboxylase biotin carboxyl carrier protein
MDKDRIREYIDLMAECGVSELEIRNGDESIRIVRPLVAAAGPSSAAGAAGLPALAAGIPATGLPATGIPATGTSVRAPMAGTFYAAPEPGAEPFVRVGQTVTPGDVLCIIESMKMMNEIIAERGGVCVAVEAPNGGPVRAGDTLLRIA